MKLTSVLLTLPALLVVGCTSSPNVSHETADLGVRPTQWGVLHEFEPVAPLMRSRFVAGAKGNVPGGSAVVELLISADGKVLDAAVVESSGNPRVDEAAKTAFAGDVFPRIAGYTSSAPYVARHRVVFKESSGMAMKEWVGWPATH